MGGEGPKWKGWEGRGRGVEGRDQIGVGGLGGKWALASWGRGQGRDKRGRDLDLDRGLDCQGSGWLAGPGRALAQEDLVVVLR